MRNRFIMLLVIVAALFTVSALEVNAYNTYTEYNNILASDSPYVITYTQEAGAYSNMLIINVSGNFNNVNYLTFEGLKGIGMYNPDWSLGAGQRAGAGNAGSGGGAYFYNQNYTTWYDIMVLDVSYYTFTTDIYINLIPDLSSGNTWSNFIDIVKTNVSVYINDTLDLNTLYNRAYEQGYTDGYYDTDLLDEEIALIENNAYNNGYTDGLNENESSNYEWLLSVFYMIGYVLSIELLPSITIGAIIMIPIAIKLVPFILGLFRGGSRE